jgi:membrane fusion protein (multidrug efflux system)
MSSTPTASLPNQAKPKRNRLLIMIGLALVVLGILYALYYFLIAIHFESTDDAYVAGNVVQITPQISGTVVGIKADDTNYVKAGQELLSLDKSDRDVALEQAEAQLAQTVREVRTLYANNGTLEANIAARDADVVKARAELDRAQSDIKRRQALVETGAVSGEEMQHIQSSVADAQGAYSAAEAAAKAAREQLASNQTMTEGTSVEDHPNVKTAIAKVREAYLAASRATLYAPVSGQVAKRSVQVGQRVQPGAPLMAIVPLDNLWVDANFKEVQLRHMRIGQPVTLEADIYGGKFEYKGKILGLSAGTGGAFSLLPAQNATGNWIKVVQRVPVRIALDPKELAEHPLFIGLSMVAKVDVTDQSGPQLSSSNTTDTGYQTQAVQPLPSDADQIVQRIIAANLGHAPAASALTPAGGPLASAQHTSLNHDSAKHAKDTRLALAGGTSAPAGQP